MSDATVFHTQPPDWFDKVKDLKPGGKRRIGDALLASFNGKAYHLWSFRDRTSEVYEPALSLQEKLAIAIARREADQQGAESPEPPQPQMPHPQDWPVEARVWMHKAGLSNDDIVAMGAYWNPRMERVVVPYRTVDGGRAWIARDPGPAQKLRPKYIFPVGTRRGGGALFGTLPGAVWVSPALRELRAPVVLCEDVLSAYRVWRDTAFPTVAVQGVSLDRDAIVALANDHPIITWLDPDSYGQQGAQRIRAAFARLGCRTANIHTDRDPKFYEPGEVEIYVDDALKRIA